MNRVFARTAGLALLLAGVAPLLSGCNEPTVATASTPVSEVEVSIIEAKPHARAMVRELPGRMASKRVADVRSRVSGIIIERSFQQGSVVKAGDKLYQIDPKPYAVELQAAEAALAKSMAAFDVVSQHAARIETLTKQQAVSTAENEKAIGAVRQAQADIAGREADVARARLNLDYATIRAPIDGIVGAALVSEGALLGTNDNTNLAVIQQLNPIYADFTQSVTEMNNLRRAFESGDLDQISEEAARVRLVMDDGSVYPITGKLLFSDAKVDAHTGQVTLRGQFPNPTRELLPGMYVRVLIEQGIDADAITVPPQAIQRNGGGGAEVFIVKDDGHVAVQAVRTGSIVDGQTLVTEGLKGGERVVVEGFQKFAPGDKVKPMPWTLAKTSESAAPSKSAQAY